MPIGSGGGGGGSTAALYDFTVTGSDKASIDSAVDGATVPSFTGFSILEVHLYARTDEATQASQVNLIWNNDGTALYDWTRVTGQNATASANNTLATTNLPLTMPGSTAAASVFGSAYICVPNYTSTAGFKTGHFTEQDQSQTAATMQVHHRGWVYRSAVAVTRVKVTPNTGGSLLKVGSRLIVYGR